MIGPGEAERGATQSEANQAEGREAVRDAYLASESLAARGTVAPGSAIRPVADLSDEQQIRNDSQRELARMRREYAGFLRWLLAGQVVVADAVFVAYAWVGVGWKISDPIIAAWLGATVVQVIGVVLVVTRDLFPGGRRGVRSSGGNALS